jgi:hypothetical protein
VVPPPEATKGGGTSDRESERLHSTDEAGKLVPRAAGGGKGGVGNTELQEGQMTGTASLDTISTKLLQVTTRVRDRLCAQLGREPRSRMPELGTSGSAAGDAGCNPWWVLNGHAGGNAGYNQGPTYRPTVSALSRQ